MKADPETARLLAKRRWLFRQLERAQGRLLHRRGPARLPFGHPLYDAEDLPLWWQRGLAEAAGGLVLAAWIAAVLWLVYGVLWPQ